MKRYSLKWNLFTSICLLTALFTKPVISQTTVSLEAIDDTYLSGANTTNNYGTQTYLRITLSTSTKRGALLKWDVSSIPSNATITSVSLKLYVSTSAAATYSLYNMRRAWVEGTGSGSATGDGATWQTYDGTNSWGTNGAANTSSDRYDVNLWGAGSTTFNSTGSKTVSLNSDGLAVVQGWVSGTLSNYGLAIQNYSSSSTAYDLQISSNNITTVANRPNLVITYTVPITPTITINGTLTDFATQPGIPSAAQTYTVSGVNLTDNISITAPIGFELSTDGYNYNSSLVLTHTNGTVSSTTIYARLNSATENTYSGNIVHTSTTANTANVAVNGVVSSTSTVNLTPVDDTYMSGYNTTYNYGASTTLKATLDSDNPRGSLFKWDLTSIPSNAIIESASITLYISTSSSQTYNLYNMRRSWVEGTGSGSSTGNGATWKTYDGTNSWGANGAADTANDRYNTNLWNAGTSSFSSTGSKTVSLNSKGIDVLQSWINGSLSNYGITIQNYTGTSSTGDDLQFASSENSTTANRPKLSITYRVSNDPYILISSSLIDFSSQPGTPSSAQTYTVSGKNLLGDISITAPAGFEISTTGTTYSSNITLPQADGSVNSTTIYIRLYSATEGTFNGNIIHTSSGATEMNVSVSGTVSSSAQVSLEASIDNYLSGYNTANNYGASTTLKSTRNSSGSQRCAMMQWDLSTIPATATVTSASITLYISTSSSQTYNLYNMRRSWVEGTGSGSETKDGATWLTYDGTNTWGSSGVADTSADRYTNNLWNAGTSSFSSSGSKTVNLNSKGISVVQGWINGTTPNYGVTMQNYTSTSGSDDLQFSSSENASNAGPTLNITYSVATGTTYTLTIAVDGNGSISMSPIGGIYSENSVVTLTPVPENGYLFSSWDGQNDEELVNNGNNTWSITMNGNKSLTATFTETPTNDVPNDPVLVNPADNGTDISISPNLQVTVSDPDASDNLDVSFYGRAAGTTSAGKDFMLVLIPDPQNETQNNSSMLTSQMNWIVNHQTDSNIVFVSTTGDLINTSSSEAQYQTIDAAFDILDAAGVPYSPAPGNHDIAYGTTYYPNYFGASRISGKSWYGGKYNDYNTFSYFSVSGNDLLLINLQYSPSTAVINWADSVLAANSNRMAIIEQHDILNIDNSWNNQTSYTALRDNSNLFMMICGHMHSPSDGAAYVAGIGTDGHTIHIVQADYQDMSNGNGYLRLFRFSPAHDMVYMTTYSPYTDGFISSTTNYDKANLVFDLQGNTAADYTLINTVNDISNGANASVTWPNLTENTKYEWYTTVSDGTLKSTGATWSFTTGSTTTYTLSVSTAGSGSVSFDPEDNNYASGTVVTLTPTPGTGYQFSSWSGTNASDIINTNGIYTIVMNGNKAITANFTKIQYTLSIGNDGNGSVSLSPTGGVYDYGTIVSLTPTGNSGYQFASWSGTNTGDIVNNNGAYSVVMNGNKSITANFSQVQYTLSVGNDGNGSVTLDPAGGTYTIGSTVTLIPAANTGYVFSSWTGANAFDVISNNGIYTIVMNGNKSITANFSQIQYTLSAGNDGNGSVTLDPAGGTYTIGSTVTLTPVANPGYEFSSWTGVNASDIINNNGAYTIVMNGNKSITANFAQIKYTLSVGNDGNGSVTLDPAGGTYVAGTTVTLTPAANSGFEFSSWSGTNASDIVNTNGVYTMVMNSNKSITANFTQIKYTLTVGTDGNGSVILDPTGGTYAAGTTVNLTPAANSGYEFSSWTGTDASEITNINGIYAIIINGNKSVTANYNLIPEITVTLPNGGQHWMAGSIHNITWTSVNISSTVHVEFSSDNGNNWNDIAINESNDGNYQWTVPNALSDECLIKVSDTDGVPSDISDAVFSITTVPVYHFNPVWSGNGNNHMNFYAHIAKLDGTDLQPGDEIGIFDGSYCVGSGIITTILNGSDVYLSIKVSQDDEDTPEIDGYTADNTASFKIWDSSAEIEISNVSITYESGSNTFAFGSTTWFQINGFSYIQQEISLLSGWNIFSLYVTPENISMMEVLKPLIDNEILTKVQDEKGNAIELNPISNNWINNIGSWSITEGYKIKVKSNATLNVTGTLIDETVNIGLLNGWNIISYPVSASYDAPSILNSLINAGTLVKAQDESGNAIEINPLTQLWINNIGTFDPDEGYKIKVSGDANLSINPATYGSGSNLKSSQIKTIFASIKSATILNQTSHFKPIWTGNGLDQMNIYITFNHNGDNYFDAGDEIGIFDGDYCVGSAVIINPDEEVYSLIVSADDPTTEEIDGFINGNKIIIKTWKSAFSKEVTISDLEFIKGSRNVFAPMGTSAVQINQALLDLENIQESFTGLLDNYPNPFDNITYIPFIIGSSTYADVSVYDVLGNKIETLLNESLIPGKYLIEWGNREDIRAGIYLIRLTTDNKVVIKTIEKTKN